MRPPRSIFVLCALLLAVVPAFARQRAKASPPKRTNPVLKEVAVRTQIEEIAHQSEAAFARKDVKGCLFYLAEGFQGTSLNGKTYGRQEAEKALPRMLAMARSVRSISQIQKFALVNGQAIVMERDSDDYEIVSRKTGVTHHLVFLSTARSIWVRQKGNWRMWRTQRLSESVMRDGKAVTLKSPAVPKKK